VILTEERNFNRLWDFKACIIQHVGFLLTNNFTRVFEKRLSYCIWNIIDLQIIEVEFQIKFGKDDSNGRKCHIGGVNNPITESLMIN